MKNNEKIDSKLMRILAVVCAFCLVLVSGPVSSFAVSAEAEGQSIFTTQTPDSFLTGARYELGTCFTVQVSGKVTAARIYTHESEGGVHTVRLWNYDTQTLVAGPYNWDITAGTAGWKQFELPEAVAIEPGTNY